MFLRSPRAASRFASGSVCFSTGTDSPVSAASSTCRLTASISRTSAGLVAGPQQDHIARHEFAGRSSISWPSRSTVARARPLPQGLDGPFGPIFLEETQQHGKQHDHGDRHGFHPVAQEGRQHRGHEQNDDQYVLELLQQQFPRRHALRRLQFVRAVDPQPPVRLRAGQARRGGLPNERALCRRAACAKQSSVAEAVTFRRLFSSGVAFRKITVSKHFSRMPVSSRRLPGVGRLGRAALQHAFMASSCCRTRA